MQYIYIITNSINSKVYIGKTKRPDRRWYEHKIVSKRSTLNIPLHNALRLYGIENFSFSIIATCLKDEYAEEAEIAMIKQYNSFKNGYNATEGGDGVGRGETHWNWMKKGRPCPQKGKFGKDVDHSQIWEIIFNNGRIITVHGLKQWAKENGYNQSCLSMVAGGKRKCHRDIISIRKIS